MRLVSLFVFFLAGIMFTSAEAEAGCKRGLKWNPYRNQCTKKITCRDAGLTYNRDTGTCNWTRDSSRPRYQGRGEARNDKCNRKPAAQNMAGFRTANSRIPFVHPAIYAYLQKLKASCPGLSVQSTYRDCNTNSSLRGSSRNSLHLCGGAADTSGCPGTTSKEMAQRICRASGLFFINEGGSRFPHCQLPTPCR